MKKFSLSTLFIAAALSAAAADGHAGCGFCKNFADSTLRVDYIFGGGPSGIHIMLDSQSKSAGWYGRRAHLKEAPYLGNGTITVIDPQTRDTLYMNSFSSLFQEWINTPEAKSVNNSFENSFQVPLPKREAEITVELRDNRHKPIGTMTHLYRPDDELVAIKGENPYPHKYIHKGGDPKKAIDVAMIAEGYRPEEMDSFINHAQKFADVMLSYEPYASNKDKFNFVAVMVPSRESGVSVPLKKQWKDTAFGSHYSTFYSSRYLTSPHVKKMHDALSGIPYEHIMVLVNTDEYGGGGIYNSYHIAAAKNQFTLPVTVHEFGHSFGGLADEYFYENDIMDESYPLDIEPWEPNITTLVDFPSKWQSIVPEGTPVPTDPKNADKYPVGVYEGGGYVFKGVYRPADQCRMRNNTWPAFCPACQRALSLLIDFYTK